MDEIFCLFCDQVVHDVVSCWSENQHLPWPSEFSTCKTDWERVRVLMSLPGVRAFFLEQVDHKQPFLRGTKADSVSERHREAGNQAWRKGDLESALHSYTQAVFFALSPQCKALAFANRSCVLARIGADSAVVEDIDQAFQHGYPPDRRCRLLVRRGQSLLHSGQASKAKFSFIEAQQSLSTDSITYPKSMHDLIAKYLASCDQATHSSSIPVLEVFPHGLENSASSTNNFHPSEQITDYLPNYEVQFEGDDIGWNVVASRKLRPGDLIFVDKPYGRRLHCKRLLSHCYQCFRRCLNLLPCRLCSEVGFCSAECEAKSWDDWSNPCTKDRTRSQHRFECGQVCRLLLLDYACWSLYRDGRRSVSIDKAGHWKQFVQFLKSVQWEQCIGGPNNSWLSFACVAETPPPELISLIQNSLSKSEASTSPGTLLAFTGKRSRPDPETKDFSSIGWLSTNSEKRTLVDLWQRTISAVFLTHCLSAGGYPLDWDSRCFHDPVADGSLPPDAKLPASWAAAVLLHLFQSIATNAHTFYSSVHNEEKLFEPDTSQNGINLSAISHTSLAACFYPTLSLLNHSCNPNVSLVSWENGTCGLFALHPICAGQRLYGNYGFHYATHDKAERQNGLREQYLFTCTCQACSESWPRQVLDSKIRCFECEALMNRCNCTQEIKLKVMVRFSEMLKLFEQNVTTIPSVYAKHEVGNLPLDILREHIDLLRRFLYTAESVVARPSMPYEYSQELLKLLLDMRFGMLEIVNCEANANPISS